VWTSDYYELRRHRRGTRRRRARWLRGAAAPRRDGRRRRWRVARMRAGDGGGASRMRAGGGGLYEWKVEPAAHLLLQVKLRALWM